MERKEWQAKRKRGLSIYQWVCVIPGTIFIIMSHRTFWQELLVLLLINSALNLGGTYLAWFFAPDGRKAQGSSLPSSPNTGDRT